MSTGRTIFIAFFTSALTSAGVFFALRALAPASAPPPAATPSRGPATAPPAKEPSLSASSGAPATQVMVPKVEGLPLSDALRALMNSGFKVDKVTRRASDAVAADRVISTTPQAGVAVKNGATINLTVSNGPAGVEIPKVVGRRVGSGRALLIKAGFKVVQRRTYDEDRAEGVILRQSPKKGEKAAVGSTVTITVNQSD